MDRETIRQMILDGDAKLMNSIIWRHLSTEQQRLVVATKNFWVAQSPECDAALDKIFAIYQALEG